MSPDWTSTGCPSSMLQKSNLRAPFNINLPKSFTQRRPDQRTEAQGSTLWRPHMTCMTSPIEASPLLPSLLIS